MLIAALAVGGGACSAGAEARASDPAALDGASSPAAPADAASDPAFSDDAASSSDRPNDDPPSDEGDSKSDDVVTNAADGRPLRLCVRLSDPERPVKLLDLSADVRTGYLSLVAADCNVSGVFPPTSAQLAAWSNLLYDWNLDLWGCTDRAATGFALIPAEVSDLTSTDAGMVIDDYLEAAARTLKLSPSEASRMRQDLAALAQPRILRQSNDHPYSECGLGDAAGPDASDTASNSESDGG